MNSVNRLLTTNVIMIVMMVGLSAKSKLERRAAASSIVKVLNVIADRSSEISSSEDVGMVMIPPNVVKCVV